MFLNVQEIVNKICNLWIMKIEFANNYANVYNSNINSKNRISMYINFTI